jgi:ketosteroid isomerase-like protein
MTLKEATMAGQHNLHIVREIFAAWNAHDVEGLVKRLDTKTTWKSDAFPAPFSGMKGLGSSSGSTSRRFPDLHFDIEQILPAGDSHVVGRWRSKAVSENN